MSSITTGESPWLRDTVCAVTCFELSRAVIHRKFVSACYKCILLTRVTIFNNFAKYIHMSRHRKICKKKKSDINSAVYNNTIQNSEKIMDLRFSAG